MFGRIAAFTSVALVSASCATKAVEKNVSIPTWKCEDCTPEEQYVLSELQEHTRITDRNALATILGNIKQESKFHSNICEGGARVPYSDCHRGGYGLIQWTTENRYLGLGLFCDKYNWILAVWRVRLNT